MLRLLRRDRQVSEEKRKFGSLWRQEHIFKYAIHALKVRFDSFA
jgi:hypothetical protein